MEKQHKDITTDDGVNQPDDVSESDNEVDADSCRQMER
jgi:hypothetical protein